MKSPKLLSMRYDHHFTSNSSCLFDQSYCSVLVLRNATGADIAECYETCFMLLSAYRLLEFFHANEKPANNNYFFRNFIKQKDT